MADFDQLIKDKVDGAQYPYKSSAWKHFTQKAGFKAGMTPLLKAILSVTTVAVIGGGTFGVVSFVRHQQPTAQPTTSFAQDTTISTVSAKPTDNTVKVSSGTACSVSEKKSSSNNVTSTSASVGSAPNHVVAPTVASKAIPKEKILYGRPLIINPDTIKTNEPTEEQIRNGHSRIVEQ